MCSPELKSPDDALSLSPSAIGSLICTCVFHPWAHLLSSIAVFIRFCWIRNAYVDDFAWRLLTVRALSVDSIPGDSANFSVLMVLLCV